MEESTLVRVLIIIGIFLLISIITLNNLIQKKFTIFSVLAAEVFCKRDADGNYILAAPLSSTSCMNIFKMYDAVSGKKICEKIPEKDKAEACTFLDNVLRVKVNECINSFTIQEPSSQIESSPLSDEIKKSCEVLMGNISD